MKKNYLYIIWKPFHFTLFCIIYEKGGRKSIFLSSEGADILLLKALYVQMCMCACVCMCVRDRGIIALQFPFLLSSL